MATTTPGQAFRIPVDGDDPDIPRDIERLALDVEHRVMGVYNNVADRTARITSPEEGQMAYLKDTNKITYYTGAAWADAIPATPDFSHGSVVPSNVTGSNGDVFFKI